jgi:hypothetical protein
MKNGFHMESYELIKHGKFVVSTPHGAKWNSRGAKKFFKEQMKYLEKQFAQGIKKNS